MAIRVLPDDLINQIAAGEVVERPASVVRELLDNALDAEATRVEVVLRDGGRELIRVVDNGIGMTREDAELCIERHATSKIQRAEDLYGVKTMGFRGEALPSIASVSRFELNTKSAESEVGFRVRVEGGKRLETQEVGLAQGTSVNVRNLFFNVPVRRKFLRTTPTEMGHCTDIVMRTAMCRPDVSFVLTMDERTLLRAPAANTAAERIGQLLGPDGRNLWLVTHAADQVAIRGWVSSPTVHRSSAKNSLFLIVNGRPVQDPLLKRSVSQAFRGCLPKGRFPIVVLSLELADEAVDVNVHPAKTEVRFKDPRAVGLAMCTALEETLSAHGITRIPTFEKPSIQDQIAPHPLDDPRLFHTAPPASEDTPQVHDAAPQPPQRSLLSGWLNTPFPTFRTLKVLGPIGAQWMACTSGEALYILDTLRIFIWLTLQDLRRASTGETPDTRKCRDIGAITLAPKHVKALISHQDHLERMGLEITVLSPTSIVASRFPRPLWETDVREAIQAVAVIASQMDTNDFESLRGRVELELARLNLPKDPPNLSNYDMRMMLAALDEVEPDPSWSIERLWLEIEGRP